MKINNAARQLKYVMMGLILLIASSCATKRAGTLEQFNGLTSIVERDAPIRIAINSVNPTNTYASQQVINNLLIRNGDNANRIDVTGDGNYMEISENLVEASLPYFGERRQGGGYNNINESGVNFEQEPTNYQIQALEEEYRYDVSFEASNGAESFNVDVILFAGGNAVVYVTSTYRTRIEYRGRVVPVPEKQ